MAHIEKSGPNRYKARLRGPDGREHSKPFQRRVDAERWLALGEADKARGRWVDPALARTPFSAWAARWAATIVHLKPKTAAGYQSLLRSRILPVSGSVPLAAIDGLMLREWITDLQAVGLRPPGSPRRGRYFTPSSRRRSMPATWDGTPPTG